MDYFPVFLALAERPCLVVGGGAVAARKIALLLRARAAVTVVARRAGDEVRALHAGGRLVLEERDFRSDDVTGHVFIVAATDAAATNAAVAAAAHAHGILVNVVDQPADSSAIMPSIVDRSPVVVAIGTGGRAPVLARLLRARLETLIPPAYGELASLLGGLRARVRAALPDASARRRFWESVLDGPAAELFFAGRRAQAEAAVEALLAERARAAAPRGEVYLIGTGPGDPDLLTFRALRLMQLANVVVHDRLVGDDILELCRRDADRIYVGKARSRHAVAQEDINARLAREALAGRRVARLKGGDPFTFGRGGEEIEHLAAAGIDFQVVPGITAALGCAAYAGIPLTHRDHAHACLFVTAHHKAGSDELALDWPALVRPAQTLVIYMGVATLTALVDGLRTAGMPPAMPIAIVERGTTRAQRVIVGTLDSIVARAGDATSPAIIIVG
ncbi:MAG: siroheme synthase CysG, partial [Gammaproteobacteria bacterium]